MLISAFTIIRNGIVFDFPFLESIQSALPLCDEYIVNIGISDDVTAKAIEDLKSRLPASEASKIITFESRWPFDDAEKRKGGKILSEQTNLALDRCKGEFCLYLQADEVLHEADVDFIRRKLSGWKDNKKIEGAVFDYVHFYGNYNVVQTSRSSYRREVRAIRNGLGISSTGDAQSFLHADGRKLSAALIGAKVYHYGWVRPQEVMKAKTGFMDTLYHPEANALNPATGSNYQYKRIVGLQEFTGTHPKIMAERVRNAPCFDFSRAPKVFHWKDTWKLVSGWYESTTGHRPFEYKNYRLVNP